MTGITNAAFIEVVEKLLPGAMGSFIALRFMPGTWWNKAISFISGMACSHFFGSAINEILKIEGPFTKTAVLFTVGVFGLSIVHQLQPMIHNMVSDVWSVLIAALKRWFGA